MSFQVILDILLNLKIVKLKKTLNNFFQVFWITCHGWQTENVRKSQVTYAYVCRVLCHSMPPSILTRCSPYVSWLVAWVGCNGTQHDLWPFRCNTFMELPPCPVKVRMTFETISIHPTGGYIQNDWVCYVFGLWGDSSFYVRSLRPLRCENLLKLFLSRTSITC